MKGLWEDLFLKKQQQMKGTIQILCRLLSKLKKEFKVYYFSWCM